MPDKATPESSRDEEIEKKRVAGMVPASRSTVDFLKVFTSMKNYTKDYQTQE